MGGSPRATCYSRRLDEAVALATDAFRDRTRKGRGRVPYVTHLLQVLVTVGEHGGDEDQLIAAVLHDYLEDIEEASRDVLAARFGERVASLVEALSDATTHPKPPWEARKRRFIAKLAQATADVKLICAADKLHNASSILREMRQIGDEAFTAFTATRTQTLWYYRASYEALATGWDAPILEELERTVRALHDEAGEPWPDAG